MLQFGLLASLAAACSVSPSKREKPIPVKNFGRYSTGGNARKFIESWPNVKTEEMVWSREKDKQGKKIQGQLTDITLRRFPRRSRTDGMFLDSYSYVRSVPAAAYPGDKRQVVYVPSVHQLRFLLEGRIRKSVGVENLKVIHVAPVSKEGKVMGYVSFGITKRWVKLEKTNQDRIWFFLDKLKRLDWSDGRTGREHVEDIVKTISNLQKMGIKMSVHSMPDFAFKEGVFVEKPK